MSAILTPIQPAARTKNLTVRLPSELHTRIERTRKSARERGLMLDLNAALVQMIESALDDADAQLAQHHALAGDVR